MTSHSTSPDSVYTRIGGEQAIRALVGRFYDLMDQLPEAYTVRSIHPESLQGSADSLFKFLSGWFGGPPLFIEERGHPRLRMRHAPYAIGPVEGAIGAKLRTWQDWVSIHARHCWQAMRFTRKLVLPQQKLPLAREPALQRTCCKGR